MPLHARSTAQRWHNALRPSGPRQSGPTSLARRPAAGGAVSAPFILAPGEKHPGAPPLERPFFRFASGQTDGLLTLAEVRLPPLTAGPTLHVHAHEDGIAPALVGSGAGVGQAGCAAWLIVSYSMGV